MNLFSAGVCGNRFSVTFENIFFPNTFLSNNLDVIDAQWARRRQNKLVCRACSPFLSGIFVVLCCNLNGQRKRPFLKAVKTDMISSWLNIKELARLLLTCYSYWQQYYFVPGKNIAWHLWKKIIYYNWRLPKITQTQHRDK